MTLSRLLHAAPAATARCRAAAARADCDPRADGFSSPGASGASEEVSHPEEVAANAAAAQRLYSGKARFETERYVNAEAPAGAAATPADTEPEAAVDAEVAELGRVAAAAFRELDIAGAPELTPDQAENRRRLGGARRAWAAGGTPPEQQQRRGAATAAGAPGAPGAPGDAREEAGGGGKEQYGAVDCTRSEAGGEVEELDYSTTGVPDPPDERAGEFYGGERARRGGGSRACERGRPRSVSKPAGAAQYRAPVDVRRATLEPGTGGAGARGPAEEEEGGAPDPGAARGYSS
jgi:hypothetical protein